MEYYDDFFTITGQIQGLGVGVRVIPASYVVTSGYKGKTMDISSSSVPKWV